MNREIKFRAWDKKLKQMCNPQECDYEFVGDKLYIGALREYGTHDEFEHFEIMQYTGLKDKNGKEIYEGDIFETKPGHYWAVYWSNSVGRYSVKTKNVWKPSIGEYIRKSIPFAINRGFVIGNIYENPELLNPALEQLKQQNPHNL